MLDDGNVGVIVQARMGSRRLPGKVLRPLAGKAMLQYVLERVGRCARADLVVVCTSTRADDDPIQALCASCGVDCFRGDHDNVAGRFMATLDHYGFDTFVRVCGDSPLIDSGLIDRGVEIHNTGRYEIVTNNLERTFPSGQTVEVLRSDTYRRGFSLMRTPEHFEHVTRYFYENSGRFLIHNFTAEEDCSGGDLTRSPMVASEFWCPPSPALCTLSVDTLEDLERIGDIIERMHRPHWQYGWREIIAEFCTVPQ